MSLFTYLFQLIICTFVTLKGKVILSISLFSLLLHYNWWKLAFVPWHNRFTTSSRSWHLQIAFILTLSTINVVSFYICFSNNVAVFKQSFSESLMIWRKCSYHKIRTSRSFITSKYFSKLSNFSNICSSCLPFNWLFSKSKHIN